MPTENVKYQIIEELQLLPSIKTTIIILLL